MASVPKVQINFKQKATSLISRSERGTAILLLNDDTLTKGGLEETPVNIVTNIYKSVSDIKDGIYTTKNLKYIKNCLNFAPYEVVVISGNSTNFADFALHIMKVRSSGWIAFPGAENAQEDLASWIKSMENKSYTYKGVGTIANKDCKQYVYFNQAGKDLNDEEVTAVDYLASLLGIVASCNVKRGCTNFLCSDLSTITEVQNIETAVESGQLVLTNDIGGVKIVAGINSLKTLNGSTATEDMQYIETVEVMNLIKDDLESEFKEYYQGNYKNKYQNQMLFIGAVNAYFDNLASEDILDTEYNNKAYIDIDAQRTAWLGSGKDEASGWDDDKIKKMSYKRSVFIGADIKILNCMENLKFTVNLQ